jgi:hypothetical protein
MSDNPAVRLRGGDTAHPSGIQGRWGPGQWVEGIGCVWRPRWNNYGELWFYFNSRGERVDAYDPTYRCTKCRAKRNSHTGKPPRGWIVIGDKTFCARCK